MKAALAYVKQHWKEGLALTLAAIPAAFIVFHKGAQQAASGAITYIPATFGGGIDSATQVDPVAAASSQAQAVGSGVNQGASDPGPVGPSFGGATDRIIWSLGKNRVATNQPPGSRTSVEGNTGTLVKSPLIKRRLP